MPQDTRRRLATALGALAIVLWGALALFTAGTEGLPPFQVLTISFAMAFLGGVVWIAIGRGPGPLALARATPAAAWALGVGGLFLYHAAYFVALKNAPPAEASLIAYLWPLLIVLFSAFLPGERLLARHLIAACIGLAGAALLILRGEGGEGAATGSILGYGAAAACALIWSGYSVLNRTQAAVPTEAMGLFCGVVALLGLIAHLSLESWVAPTSLQWLALIALGLGPVGLAFFVWDHGTKHGDLPLLGVLSYASPVISTLLLVATGVAAPSWTLALGCTLIVGAAVVAMGGGRRADAAQDPARGVSK